eukprot:COSAG02_NODE_50685_length_319_cov_0.618182_1_plen_106_part_11
MEGEYPRAMQEGVVRRNTALLCEALLGPEPPGKKNKGKDARCRQNNDNKRRFVAALNALQDEPAQLPLSDSLPKQANIARDEYRGCAEALQGERKASKEYGNPPDF